MNIIFNYKFVNKKLIQKELMLMKELIFKSIEIAFNNKINQHGESEIDEKILKQYLDNIDIMGALSTIKYYNRHLNYVIDVNDSLIDIIHEELRRIEFPEELNGFDYEWEYGTNALMEYLEQKEKNDLENEVFENLRECPNHCYADVDLFILENRVEKYKDEIIKKIKIELEK